VTRTLPSLSGVRHPALAAELKQAWLDGEFATLGEFDGRIAQRLGSTTRWARIVRSSWGIEGHRGQTPTRPPK